MGAGVELDEHLEELAREATPPITQRTTGGLQQSEGTTAVAMS